MQQKTFSERVVDLACSVPPGRITTYGDIARAAGGGGQSARSVTGILGKAYQRGRKDIPFHRIVYAGGRIWMSDEHRNSRMTLYKKEGIHISKKGIVIDFDALRM